jgi:hypothetical protein
MSMQFKDFDLTNARNPLLSELTYLPDFSQ